MILKSKLVLPVLPRLHNPCHGNIRVKVSGIIFISFAAFVSPSIPGILTVLCT